jgi:hypothetical protein
VTVPALRPDLEEDLHDAFAAYADRVARHSNALAAAALGAGGAVRYALRWAPLIAAAVLVPIAGGAVYLRWQASRERRFAARVVDAVRDRPGDVARIERRGARLVVSLTDGTAASMKVGTKELRTLETVRQRCPEAHCAPMSPTPVARVVDRT